MTTNTILTTAVAAWAADLSVIPISNDGTKMPPLAWKPHQTERADLDTIRAWFTNTSHGLGIITGEISGRLEMLEIEGRALNQLPELERTATDTLGALWHRINTGWREQSPSGGIHWFYRLDTDGDPMPRSTKIARDANKNVLAETRAEGALAVTAPTPGSHHETGNPWRLLDGGPRTIPTITRTERAQLHALFHAILDQTPEPVDVNPMWTHQPSTPRSDGDITPGDDFEQRVDWNDPLLLGGAGWTIATTRGRYREWVRPGKNPRDGISATTGHAGDRDRLYVFSSSTEFDTETPYTKLGAYAILHHGGDHTAAARDLANRGYGHRAPRELAPVTTITTPARHLQAVDTNGATAVELAPVTRIEVTGDPAQRTDLGNAKLTATAHQQHLVYIPDAGRWAAWTGTKWEWAPDAAPAKRAVIATIEALPDDDETLAKHRVRSMSTSSIMNAVNLLSALPEMRVPADQFDARPLELNTPAGIVDLTTGRLEPAHPLRWHSKTTTTAPSHDGAPRWEKFVDWMMCDRPELVRYLQQLAGITLLGEVRESVLPFLHGKGKNGKSVLLEVMRGVLGDYAVEAPLSLLIAGPKEHDTQFARLQGARAAHLSEVNQNARFDEAKLKQLTGGDTFAARFMRGDFFDVTPSHTFWLAGNHKPTVTAGGDSFWRRVRLIPFDNQISDEDRNENLKTELLEEAPGILQWMIDGLTDYLKNGLIEPEIVTEATREYAEEEDHLGRFLEDRVQRTGPAGRVDQAEFRRAYRDWCRDNDETELTGTTFGRELKARFDIHSIRSNGRRFYTTVLLLNDDPEGADSDPSKTHWSDR